MDGVQKREPAMLGFSPAHMLIFGMVAILLFGKRLPGIAKSLRRAFREFQTGMRELSIDLSSLRYQHAEPTMKEQLKKFLWTSKFWAVLGIVGCVSGLYFQRVAANGSGLWCLGLMFLGAAYIENKY
jgi:TatA/E family protein of Tat protein translocase